MWWLFTVPTVLVSLDFFLTTLWYRECVIDCAHYVRCDALALRYCAWRVGCACIVVAWRRRGLGLGQPSIRCAPVLLVVCVCVWRVLVRPCVVARACANGLDGGLLACCFADGVGSCFGRCGPARCHPPYPAPGLYVQLMQFFWVSANLGRGAGCVQLLSPPPPVRLSVRLPTPGRRTGLALHSFFRLLERVPMHGVFPSPASLAPRLVRLRRGSVGVGRDLRGESARTAQSAAATPEPCPPPPACAQLPPAASKSGMVMLQCCMHATTGPLRRLTAHIRVCVSRVCVCTQPDTDDPHSLLPARNVALDTARCCVLRWVQAESRGGPRPPAAVAFTQLLSPPHHSPLLHAAPW
jgi:hypothetical protein